MAKKHSEYFDYFVKLVDLACDAAEYLHTTLRTFDADALKDKRMEMHAIEHEADEVKHEMMAKLAKEFVTPIDREDIIALANEIDEVTDKIEDVLIRIYMYNIKEIRPEAMSFSDVIVRCCTALRLAVREFPNFHKSTSLHQAIIDVNTMEEDGDAIYISAMRALYKKPGKTVADAVAVMAWSETFDRLEECCDACEHVANVMESVVMKNS